MQYRRLGKTEEQVSILGFGCMRLPLLNNRNDHIDRPQAIEMLRWAIDEGVNYIDTAFPYHGTGFDKGGESEPLVAEALRDGYRSKVKLATKLPSWLIQSRADFDKYLNLQLQRLETDHIDFYLVHALNKTFWANLVQQGLFDFLDCALKDGRIKHAGFSFHDDFQTFVEIVDAYDWSFCQIQYNYIDTDYQAGRQGLQYAADKDLGIVIMEPLRGGALTRNLPTEVKEKFAASGRDWSAAEWALRWLWNIPQIGTVLSGMSNMPQTRENVIAATKQDQFSHSDLLVIEDVQKIYRQRIKVNCTACRYCMPCPVGVDIPRNFQMYNSFYLFDEAAQEAVRFQYGMQVPDEAKANKCIKCGKCLSHCPQQIKIPQELEQVKKLFSPEK
jgi:predicted aldo/keto reductase-like oxidoreductase